MHEEVQVIAGAQRRFRVAQVCQRGSLERHGPQAPLFQGFLDLEHFTGQHRVSGGAGHGGAFESILNARGDEAGGRRFDLRIHQGCDAVPVGMVKYRVPLVDRLNKAGPLIRWDRRAGARAERQEILCSGGGHLSKVCHKRPPLCQPQSGDREDSRRDAEPAE